MNFKPLQDRVVVKRSEAEKEHSGGIIIPEKHQRKLQEGMVISGGPGILAKNGDLITLQVADGDKVLFEKHAGTEITIEGEVYLIMRESGIIGVIE